MKAPDLFDFLNLRKPLSHVTFFIFSLVVTAILIFTDKYIPPPSVSFSILLLLFVQLEVFIFFGNRLFADFNFDQSPGKVTRKILVRYIFFLAACLVSSMIIYILTRYLGLFLNGDDVSKVFYDFFHSGFRYWFKSTLTGLSGGALIFIIILWQTSLRREQKLREENLIFQNETLKNQVNPHFLFNSLNTLSSLISTQPEIADRFIDRLASIYRYILENSPKDKVPLQSELAFIEDYYFLHKIRDEEKITLEIAVKDPEKYEILPVSLQILVENAIKHNIATRDNPLNISIYNDAGYVAVRNNLQKMSLRLKSTGIGLKNLAERVKLTSGKVLIIEETGTEYIVKVPLI